MENEEEKYPLDEITDTSDSDMPPELTREGILKAEADAKKPPAAEPEPEPEPEDKPEDKPGDEPAPKPEKPKQTAQERINEITAKYRTEQRARQAAEAELERYRKGDTTIEPDAQKPQETANKPQRSDFSDYEDYQEALIEWKTEQKIAEREKKAREKTLEERKKAQVQQEKTRAAKVLSDGRAKYADFDKVVTPTLKISESMARAIATSAAGADIVYYLGQNPDLSATIANLNPLETALEIGRLEATITTTDETPAEEPEPEPEPEPETETKKTVPVTRAPKPPAKLPPGRTIITEVDPDKFATQKEFEEWYFKQLGYTK